MRTVTSHLPAIQAESLLKNKKEKIYEKKKWMQLAALVAAGTMIISGCGISAGADSATTQAAAQTEQAATSETAESTDETAAADDGALVIQRAGKYFLLAGTTDHFQQGTFDPGRPVGRERSRTDGPCGPRKCTLSDPENETETSDGVLTRLRTVPNGLDDHTGRTRGMVGYVPQKRTWSIPDR